MIWNRFFLEGRIWIRFFLDFFQWSVLNPVRDWKGCERSKQGQIVRETVRSINKTVLEYQDARELSVEGTCIKTRQTNGKILKQTNRHTYNFLWRAHVLKQGQTN